MLRLEQARGLEEAREVAAWAVAHRTVEKMPFGKILLRSCRLDKSLVVVKFELLKYLSVFNV